MPAVTLPPELLISTPSQVRALASGVRASLVEALLTRGPAPVRVLAAHLARSPESLYHHLRILERAGIVRVDSIRPVGRTKEAIYALVSTRLRLDRSKSSPAMRRARASAGAAMMGAATRRLRAAINAGLDEGDAQSKRARIETVIVRLSPEARRELHACVDALWAFLREHAASEGEGCAVTVAIAPAGSPGQRGRPNSDRKAPHPT